MAQPGQKLAKRTAPAEDINSLERRLTSDEAFCRALRDLLSATCVSGTHATSAPPWEIQLRVFALLTVTEPCFRGLRRPPDAFLTGKTPKALANFASRLRAMAAEIECVNRSPFFHLPDLRLPLEMQLHADQIERSIPFARWRTHGPRGHSRWVFQLSDLVKRVTGHWHDEKVSRLLNEAANALKIDFQLDAEALAQARHRKKPRA